MVGGEIAKRLRDSEIPGELRGIAQWVCWRAEERQTSDGKKKMTKVPINPGTGGLAATDDRSTWGTFDEALTMLDSTPGLSGVGFVFTRDDPYCGIDCDGCRVDGVVDLEAATATKELASYGEVSQSGNGIHVILKGSLPPGGRRKGRWELYDSGRFFVMTGNRLPWCPETVEHRQDALAKFHRCVFGGGGTVMAAAQVDGLVIDPKAGPPIDLFEALRENNPKFDKSWRRRRSDLPDQSASSYDMSLAVLAYQAGWKDQEVADLIVASRRVHGDDLKTNSSGVPRIDYFQRTLAKAKASAGGDEKLSLEIDMGVQEGEEKQSPSEILEKLSRRLGLEADPIARVVRINTEPSSYRLYLQSGRTIELGGIAGILDQGRFRSSLADIARKVAKGVSKTQWEAMAQLILDVLEDVDPGVEGSLLTQIGELVLEYLEETPPSSGQDWQEAAMQHLPFVSQDGHTCLSLRGLMVHRMKVDPERISSRKIAASLRLLGWENRPVCWRDTKSKVIKRNVWHRRER